jgi:hypothetical protein
MIDETLFKTNHLGKDGFIWWLGQVAPYDVWKKDSALTNPDKSKKNWGERCKVRIIGYHTFNKVELADEELPWAHILLDPGFGSAQGGEGMTTNLVGGESCFGFFLDGDDAQQPVVVGLLYRSAAVKNYDIDNDIAFRPFTGHPNNNITPTKLERREDKIVKEATTAPITPSQSQAGIGWTEGKFTFNTDLDFGVNSTIPNVLNYGDKIIAGEVSQAMLGLFKKTDITFTAPNGCNNNHIVQITEKLQTFISFTNGLDKYANVYLDPVLNEIVDIKNTIKNTARSIVGIIRLIINNIRNGIIKCIISQFKRFIGLIIPPPQQTIAAQAAKNILDVLFCLLEKIINQLVKYVEDLLSNMVDSVFNAPACAVEQWTSAVLSGVMNTIEDSISSLFSGIDWLTGGVTHISNMLNQASSLASVIYNYIGCDGLKCATPSTWSSRFGPSYQDSDNWNKIVNNVNIFNGIKNDTGSIENSLSELSLMNGTNSAYLSCNESVNNPKTQSDIISLPYGVRYPYPIPPSINVYGDGIGGILEPVIGDNGSLVSVDIVSSGIDYTYPPTLKVIDKSGYGSGATIEATINENGTIDKVYVTNPGIGYTYQSQNSTNSIGAGNRIGCLVDIKVLKPGFAYSSQDTINIGIHTFIPIVSPGSGSIVSIKPIQYPICEFTDNPPIVINTNTGVGAKLIPVIEYKAQTVENITSISGITSVVDCV